MSEGARPPHRESEDVEPHCTSIQALCDAVGSMRHVPELRGVTGGTSFPTPPSTGAGTHQVPRRWRGRSGSVRCPDKSGNDAASSFVPGDAPPTPPLGTPSVCTRFSWPSLRRVFICRGVQSEGFVFFRRKCVQPRTKPHSSRSA